MFEQQTVFCKTQDFSDSMCHGLGFIVVLTVIVYTGLVYYKIIVPLLGESLKKLFGPLLGALEKVFSYTIVQIVFGLAIIAGLVTFIAIDSKGATCTVKQVYPLEDLVNP